ncbi:hypothetical protein DSD19_04670 [Rhodovulum sp. BSW8]|uniref:hypothetical protein n=1 Tax=Rhodovulum sp. BSW8 TaxID=2259645 RepID=UPI000DE2467E|nr:hypothetical protein [Rhodovulum sp. BSW8]RBO54673.1 hypothetical protein DSD19_04670 [Rhodovulum sp. BSW8]
MPAPSAKSLFRATKAKRPRDARQIAAFPDLPDQRAPARDVRRADDFYPTGQPEAIRALLAADGDCIAALGRVWEPAVGDGDLAREIEAFGVPVRGGDIVQRKHAITCLGDFLDTTEAAAPAIITNPPYDKINARDGHGRWLRHTLALPGWEYCALLLKRADGTGAIRARAPASGRTRNRRFAGSTAPTFASPIS